MAEIIAIVGIVLALLALVLPIRWDIWKNRKQAIEDRKRQEIARAEKITQLLTSYERILDKNSRLLDQIEKELPKQVIFYGVDILIFEATASLRHEILDDAELIRLIDSVYFELLHLQRKIDLQLEMWASAQQGNLEKVMCAREEVVGRSLAQLAIIRSEIQQAEHAITRAKQRSQYLNLRSTR